MLETRAAFFDWREARPSKHCVPEDDLVRTLCTFSGYISAPCALTSALEELTGAGEFSELRPEKSSNTNTKYLFRNGCHWSSRRTLAEVRHPAAGFSDFSMSWQNNFFDCNGRFWKSDVVQTEPLEGVPVS